MTTSEENNGFDPRHPHERWEGTTIPVVLDPEGRCVVCSLLVDIDRLTATLRDVQSLSARALSDTDPEDEVREWDDASRWSPEIDGGR